MAMDFHSANSRHVYADRHAHTSWADHLSRCVDFRGKQVVDIGCGGGIYSRALADLGAAHVFGIDSSDAILQGAVDTSGGYPQISFSRGDACATGLQAETCDIVVERALLHHLNSLPANFVEVFRILRPGGSCIIQERTMEDVLLPPSSGQ